MDEKLWDLIVVGGGAAGLSAALTLGRARRRVLVVDAGQPRNRFTRHMHAVLGRDGTSPADLLADGRREVESYRGVIRRASVSRVTRADDGFVVALDDTEEQTRRLLVATGVRDVLPELAGLAQWWGRGVAVCPYCDAYEVRDGRVGILATGPASVFQAQLLRQWTRSVSYLADAVGAPDGEERAGFDARGIEIVEGPVARVLDDGGRLTGVEMGDGRHIPLDAIFTVPTLVPADDLLRSLGAVTVEGPMGAFVQVDNSGRTSVDGVWGAGNVVNPAANVPIAIAAGAAAAGAINHDLVLDDIARARTARRSGA